MRRRIKRLLAASVAAVMVTTLTLAVPALAQPDPGPPVREREPIAPVAVRPVSPAEVAGSGGFRVAGDKPVPVWPAAGTAVAPVPAAPVPQPPGAALPDGGLVEPAQTVSAGGLPVRVDRPAVTGQLADPPARVRVQVLGRAATERAGIRGVLLRLTGQDVAGHAVETGGAVRLSVDYSAFATGYGADWASRLRLVAMPVCGSGGSGCAGEPLRTENHLTARTLAATVDLAGGSVLLGVMAAPAGPAGDFAATSLQSSSTWSAGGSSGGFTWSYPMRVPPGVGGPTPGVALSYASQSVDGRHAASNNQPSWVGEGFEAWPGGFIERRYRPCAKDMGGGANNSSETGDLCWATDNAVMSLNGSSGELLYNASEQRWHLRSDDGSRIERKTGGTNGDADGEYWVVTRVDGTQYWFGVNRLPGWSSGDPVTSSTWTAPVFGNHAGEPCHAASFGSSSCAQAWRWNLDYVVDVHGNSMSYWYTRETNRYARNLATSSSVTYHRGGYLTHISYGTRRTGGVDDALAGDPPAQVVFAVADRCLSSCGTKDETHWPDTPWDQECTGASCQVTSPTFWTTKRLASVTPRVWGGSSYRNVERWTFTHSFPDPGDTTRAGLWLDSIAHEGLVGGTVSLPDVDFTPVSLDNRVDEIDHSPAMAWHRIARIDTETGGAIAVTYSDRDCESSKPTPHTNTSRCYPVYWTPEGEQEPLLDWFHKYVVTELREVDMVGGQPEVIHRYSYLGGAAWHYTDDDGLVDKDAKTWSVWRGYGRAGVTVGEGDTERTYTESRYFRGMHGDKLPSGTRSVDVIDSNGGTWPDHDWFAGMERESIVFNGPGGAEVSGQINDPWASAPTAARTINGTTVHARFANVATGWSRLALDGGRGERTTRVTMTFDSLGMATQMDDHGDTAVSGDEQCMMRTYTPRNTTAWVVNAVHRSRSFAVDCAAAASPASLGDDDVITDERTWFDGNGYGVASTRGLPTQTEEMSAWNAGSPAYVTTSTAVYDAHGRAVEARDALNRPTFTGYTPAAGGPVTSGATTNALGHVTTTTLDPAFGLPTRTVDPNGKQTEFGYDPLGRVTGVWLPGRDKATQTPNLGFDYGVRDNDVTFVTTRRLNPLGAFVTRHALFDGLLRPVQTQVPSPAGGRILTNTFYDNAGRAFEDYAGYYTAGSPSTALHIPIEPFDVPTQTRSLFDGAGRVTAEVFRPFNQERWRTSYHYGGDRVDTTPPDGATATSTVTDAQGRMVELRQYAAPAPIGTYDSTTYGYNRKGQLAAVTDPAGNEWSYVYDLRGRQIESHDPDSGRTRMEYDNADQLTGVIDGRNTNRVAYKYDALGRKTHIYRDFPFGTPLASWSYDLLAKGQLDRSIRFVGGQPYMRRVNEFNDWYQPTEVDVVIPSAESGLGGTYTTNYTYHVDGSPDAVAWDATADLPTEGLHYEYDPVLGLPMTLRATLGTSPMRYVTGTDYNALGQVEQLTLQTAVGADAVRLGFDRELETGRLTDAWVDLDTAPWIASYASYDYDPAGNITRIADQVGSPADTQCFTYDHLRRLTEAWTPASGDCGPAPVTAGLGGPAPYWRSWSYDQVGNRLSQVEHMAGGDVSTAYSYPPAGGTQPHALTSATVSGGGAMAWTYDAAGNTLSRPDGAGGSQALTWDIEGRLSSVTDGGGTTSYIYDADGNRLITRDPEGKTLYLPGQEVRWDSASGTLSCTRFYDYHGRMIASRDAGGLTWLATDYQRTSQVAISEVGQQVQVRRQLPFGELRGGSPAWPNLKGFVGGDVDATGLIHLGAREYDPGIGRFISVDPIMVLTDPQQLHGYAYADNNPITFFDPTGLVCTPDGESLCPGQDARTQPAGRPKPYWEADWQCIDYCGSAADNQVREHYGVPTNGRNGTTGHVGPGGEGVTYNEAALDLNLGKWEGLTADQRRLVQWEVMKRNNPVAYQHYLATRIDPVKVATELSGLGDVLRCLELDYVSCAWVVVAAMPQTKGAHIVRAFNRLENLRGARRTVCSFSAETPVLMADGTTKPISQVKPGDLVLAVDPVTGMRSVQVVTGVWVHEDTLIDLQVTQPADGLVSSGIGDLMVTVTTTADHPFWNHTDQQWQQATSLDPGDQLHTAEAGKMPAVVGMLSYTQRQGTAYNLTVTGPHIYYVVAGGTPVLVHNCPPGGGTVPSGQQGRGLQIPDGVSKGQWLKDRAGALGFSQRVPAQKVPFDSKSQAAFFDGKRYITPDITGHNTLNGWKMFDRKGNRLGTYDSDLNYLKP